MGSVDIANRALTRVGAGRITSFGDDNEEAKSMSEIYEGCRLGMLRSHPWNFAVGRQRLALLAEDPLMEFPFQYALPDDYVRLIELWTGDAAMAKNLVRERRQWQIEGKKLLTEFQNVSIRYIKDVEEFDASFEEAFVAQLAYELSYTFQSSPGMQDRIYNLFQAKLGEAKQVDMLENQFNVRHGDQLDIVRY